LYPPLDTSKEQTLKKYTGIVREIRYMAHKLPAWRFLLLTLIGLIFALGYLSGNLPWEKW